jgi:Protein of unknown function (DUF664)
MPDRKPPRLDGDERHTVLALWQFQRESFVRKLSGVDEADARRALVASGTTLLWLAQHMARAETLWVVERFAGESAEVAGEDQPDDTLAAATARYSANWTRIDEVVRRADLDDVCRNVGDESPVNLRWVLMHLLEETARHAGHADILRELIDGATGR